MQQLPPLAELLNTYEIGEMAKRKLDAATWAVLAPADRKAFDRITFRPRMMVNTTKLDLTLELFGQKHFAPIIVGPVSHQKRFHPEGELEMAKGAAAAKAMMVMTEVATPASWYQGPEMKKAIDAGCKVIVCGKVVPKGLNVPIVVKGVMTVLEAEAAIAAGAQGIIVSNYQTTHKMEPIEALPLIADAVKGRIPILVDGGFRRGSDVLKGLALGAKAVLVARAPACGLAAYGAAGVQRAIEILQTDLGRDMAMCGKVNLDALGRDTVKIHRF